MFVLRLFLFFTALSTIAANGVFAATLRAEQTDDGVNVYVGDTLFTTYKTNPTQKYPYFHPVNGPTTGASVTTESSEPYPHHHSLFFACDRVNGGNYWQDSNERGQIVSQGTAIAEATGDRVVFTDTCNWRQPGADPVIQDTRTIVVSAPSPDIRIIDFAIALRALTDIRIEKTNHALFSARLVPELAVKAGGSLINSHGDAGEEGTFGIEAPWCDYSGARNGIVEGLAIFQSPRSHWPNAPWFTRDYGFFSPTPMYWLEDGRFDLPAGESITLRYRVVVHNENATDAQIAARYEEYADAERAQVED